MLKQRVHDEVLVAPQPVMGKRAHVSRAIEAEIRRGALRPGEQLGGENALAKQYAVSRGTIRQVLDDLKSRGLITTRMGIGSFVTFDGVALDQAVGWARALQQAGSFVETSVVDITRIPWSKAPDVSADDAETTGVDAAIRIRRLRTVADEGAISYEISVIPGIGELDRLPDTGLVDGSIWASLEREGLRAVTGTQDARLARLDDDAATLLGKNAGEAFLCTDRWSYGADGRLVEFVRAYLHPEHFRLRVTFGESA